MRENDEKIYKIYHIYIYIYIYIIHISNNLFYINPTISYSIQVLPKELGHIGIYGNVCKIWCTK